jgi:hypothetical protein
MTLKLTSKVDEFCGYTFLEGSPDVDEINETKLIQSGLFVFELFAFLKS